MNRGGASRVPSGRFELAGEMTAMTLSGRVVLLGAEPPDECMAVVARKECLRHGIRRTTDRLCRVRASFQVMNSTDSVDACTSAGRNAFEELPIDPVAGTLA